MLSHVRQVGAAIRDRATRLGGQPVRIDVREVITGRAALLELDPPTRIASGGASRLLAGADGWCALTLSRPEDLEAVPALLELPEVDDPWTSLGAAAIRRPVADFVARARLLEASSQGLLGHDDDAMDAIATESKKAFPGAVVAREGMVLRP